MLSLRGKISRTCQDWTACLRDIDLQKLNQFLPGTGDNANISNRNSGICRRAGGQYRSARTELKTVKTALFDSLAQQEKDKVALDTGKKEYAAVVMVQAGAEVGEQGTPDSAPEVTIVLTDNRSEAPTFYNKKFRALPSGEISPPNADMQSCFSRLSMRIIGSDVMSLFTARSKKRQQMWSSR